MKFLAMTHAEKHPGVNPNLTAKGKNDIALLADKLPSSVIGVIVGTGARFCDMLDVIKENPRLAQIKDIKFSPLLGSADSGKKTETGFDVFLANGRLIKIGDYIGLIGTPGVDLWMWLMSFKDGPIILCTGREFIGALGYENSQTGQLFEIDTNKLSVTLIA
jgi:hypothetical protein